MRRNLLLTAMLAVFAVAAASAQRQVNEADGYRLLVAPDARQLKAARYYDVVNFARHVTVPTYVTAGIIDSLCPPTTVYAMYNQLKGEKHMLEHPTTGHILTSQGEDFSRQAVREFVRRERDTGR